MNKTSNVNNKWKSLLPNIRVHLETSSISTAFLLIWSTKARLSHFPNKDPGHQII